MGVSKGLVIRKFKTWQVGPGSLKEFKGDSYEEQKRIKKTSRVIEDRGVWELRQRKRVWPFLRF